ncbi:NAD(P)-dependent oxidoreductase [Catalinimonas sp. 4WD22]|uniref:NAD(P)-dependent oxidoreductase n=1 Tax=Catalinimonas locisalis TaxID=3133978 RepID=UPI003100CE59
MNVGFIGLGIMGQHMASNLIKDGHVLHLHNRTKEKAKPLIEQGAKFYDSPAEVANKVEMLFTMLASPEVVKKMALGDKGFLANMHEGMLWVDCSTVNPSFSREMAEEASRHHIRFIDAPVAGSKVPAEKGELNILVGGDEQDVEEAIPLLELMGKKVTHLGGHGLGTSMKMIINALLGNAMAAFAEATALGEKIGLDRENMIHTLLEAPVTAPFLKMKKDQLLKQQFDTEFPLKWMHKDMRLVTQTAEEYQAPHQISDTVKALYASAEKEAGEQDFSAIYAYLRKLNQ